MTRWRCNTCGGTYADKAADGTLYFHACPPDKVAADGTRVPYTNPRDENVVQDPETGDVTIKAEGSGRTRVVS